MSLTPTNNLERALVALLDNIADEMAEQIRVNAFGRTDTEILYANVRDDNGDYEICVRFNAYFRSDSVDDTYWVPGTAWLVESSVEDILDIEGMDNTDEDCEATEDFLAAYKAELLEKANEYCLHEYC